jgi:DnaJ-class molecular chaperone
VKCETCKGSGAPAHNDDLDDVDVAHMDEMLLDCGDCGGSGVKPTKETT